MHRYEVPMLALRAIAAVFRAIFTTRADLMVENLALRQQLNVLRRKSGRPVVLHGRTAMWKEASTASAGNARTTSSSSMRTTCTGCCRAISATTTGHERI